MQQKEGGRSEVGLGGYKKQRETIVPLHMCMNTSRCCVFLNDVFKSEVELEPRTQSCMQRGLMPVLENENSQ
jgi:hypothetical protein